MPTSKPKIYTICILILLSGTALSFGFYFSFKHSSELKRDRTLTNLYSNVYSNIQREIDRNLNALYALRASYWAFDGWDRNKFGKYASYYTGQIQSIQALEWVPVISRSQRDSFELATRNQGFKDFEIFTNHNGKITRAEPRPYYYPVYFIEPFDENKAAFGFDPGPSNITRQTAIDEAMETNLATGSDVITIIQKTNPHKAILVFVPIFDQRMNKKLIGLVEGVYLVDKLVDSALKELRLPEEVNLVISNQDHQQELLGKNDTNVLSSNVREGELTIANQTWNLRLEYLANLEPYSVSPFWLLMASLVFTVLTVKVVYDVLADNRVELEKHIKELKRKNNDLEQYTYAASHDLQEPLHSLQSLVDLIDQDYKDQLDSKGNVYLGHIRNASLQMSEQITSLLRYSRIGQTEQPMWTHSRTIIDKVLKDLEPAIQEKQASVVITTKLPILMTYPTSFRQLLYNLIANGLKFQEIDSTPKLEISAVMNEEKNWQFAIKDNGIGFSEEFSERIFTIFRTLHSRSIYPGAGFGLANCKKIVELHNGQIWVTSSPGQGSTFFFTLNLT